MTFSLSTRAQKLAVFRVSASPVCPGCGGAKSRMHWLCVPCQELVNGSAENDLLTIACSAHVLAAQNLVTLAKNLRDGG